MLITLERRKVTLLIQVPAGATHYEPGGRGVARWWRWDANADQWFYAQWFHNCDASHQWTPFGDLNSGDVSVLPLTFAD